MKKLHLVLLFSAFCQVCFSQTQPTFSWSSKHYQVLSTESEIRAMEISQKMEAALALFNELFHVDLEKLPAKLRVQIFAEKKDFDTYLQSVLSETRKDFVFLSYSDANRNELVGFKREGADFNSSLLHYGFIQYIHAAVPATPLWLEEGLAAYLENSPYDSNRETFTWRPNYLWLDSLKAILRNPEGRQLAIGELITMDKASAQQRIDVFYPTAWGLVAFLMSSPDKRVNRILWDAIAALEPGVSLAENSQRVRDRAFAWFKQEELQKLFSDAILSLKTFNDFVKEGIDLYSARKTAEAESSFKKALELQQDSYLPYYYLGLISYERKQYQDAAQYYDRAQDLGIDRALIQYALGINAFADKKYDLAGQYLRQAKSLDEKTYAEKVDSLLKRIEVLK